MSLDSKYQIIKRDGIAKNIVDTMQGNLSSIYPKNSNTAVYSFLKAIAREVAALRVENEITLQNTWIPDADVKYLYVNFGYIFHPKNLKPLLDLSIAYRKFVKVLAKYLVRGATFNNLTNAIEELTGYDVKITEHYNNDAFDISDKFTFDVDFSIPREDMVEFSEQEIITDVTLLIQILKPAHINFTVRLVLDDGEDYFTFDDDALEQTIVWTPKDGFGVENENIFTWYFSEWDGDDVWGVENFDDSIPYVIIEP